MRVPTCLWVRPQIGFAPERMLNPGAAEVSAPEETPAKPAAAHPTTRALRPPVRR